MSEQERDWMDEAVATEVPDEVIPDAEPAAETGEAAPAVPEATPAEEPAHAETVPIAALMAERDKRKNEAAQRKQLEQELAQYRQQQPQTPPQSFFEAPDEYVQQIEARATQRLHSALEAQARDTYPDYDEVFNELSEYAQENPACVPQIMGAPNPAVAAYKFGKQLRELKQMQDPVTYRQTIEAEIRAKVEAEYAAKAAERAKTANALPPDLAANRSATGQFVPKAESVFKEIFPL